MISVTGSTWEHMGAHFYTVFLRAVSQPNQRPFGNFAHFQSFAAEIRTHRIEATALAY
jgi:hypothetical protein